MRNRILHDMRFKKAKPGWDLPDLPDPRYEPTRDGLVLSSSSRKKNGSKNRTSLIGSGVHTRNGDTIELLFNNLNHKKGILRFGFEGGMEFANVELDFSKGRIALFTSDWTRPYPAASHRGISFKRGPHCLSIKKTEGDGGLIKSADIQVSLDGKLVLQASNLNILPEMGVEIHVLDTRVLVQRFIQRGQPTEIPEFLHVGGWQMPNIPSIEENLASICRGLTSAAQAGVRLLLTPETGLTGLFPIGRVTRQKEPVIRAEKKLRRFIKQLPNAPYIVVGLPVWESVPEHTVKTTRYNVSRLYDPDGNIVGSYAKIHSCEEFFQHGYSLNEFKIDGVPVSMHVCHDGRYPDVWTLPVMFGARLILHPANGGLHRGSVDAFENGAKGSTVTSHAFYMYVSGGGGSFLVSPQKYNNIIAVDNEARRDNPSFPNIGPMREGLFHANIRIHDAFGYWPVRSFRANEQAAEAYQTLYKSLSKPFPK